MCLRYIASVMPTVPPTGDLTTEGSSVYRVDITDPFQFALDFNRAARQGVGAIRRIKRALDELRDEILPELRGHQRYCEEHQLPQHPDAGQALDHIEQLDFSIQIDPETFTASDLVALTNKLDRSMYVNVQRLAPVSAETVPVPARLADDWNRRIDLIEQALQTNREAEERIKALRQNIKRDQQAITNHNVVIADGRYTIAHALVDMRAMQRTAVALVRDGTPAVIVNVAQADLRLDVYSPQDMNRLEGLLPTLRFSPEMLAWLRWVRRGARSRPQQQPDQARSEEAGGDPNDWPDP